MCQGENRNCIAVAGSYPSVCFNWTTFSLLLVSLQGMKAVGQQKSNFESCVSWTQDSKFDFCSCGVPFSRSIFEALDKTLHHLNFLLCWELILETWAKCFSIDSLGVSALENHYNFQVADYRYSTATLSYKSLWYLKCTVSCRLAALQHIPCLHSAFDGNSASLQHWLMSLNRVFLFYRCIQL